jgi:hypothetical protein
MKRIASFLVAMLTAVAAVTLLAALGCWTVQRRAGPAQWVPPTAYSGSRFWWTVLAVGAVGVVGALVVLVVARRRRVTVLVMTAMVLWAAAVVLWARSDSGVAVSFGWSHGTARVSGVGIDGKVVRNDVGSYCYVNRGQPDGLMSGTAFNIYDASKPAAPAKALIEAVSIGPGRTSQCRIIWVRQGFSVRQGDLARTLLIDPRRPLRFYFAGPAAVLTNGSPMSNGVNAPRSTNQWWFFAGRFFVGRLEQADVLVIDDRNVSSGGPAVGTEAAHAQDVVRARATALGMPAITLSQYLEAVADYAARDELAPARPRPPVMEERRLSLESRDGALAFTLRDVPAGVVGENVLLWGRPAPPTPLPASGAAPAAFLFSQPRWFSRTVEVRPSVLGSRFGYDHSLSVTVPYWIVAAVLSIPPIAWALRRSRLWRRTPAGCCPGCEYDLRASSGRCPECGRVIGALATG